MAAALTILLAYLAAGAPPQDVPPFGRFEDWARRCRDPLVWLGEADPCASRQRIEGGDPVREELVELLAPWHAVFGGSGQTVAGALTTLADLRRNVDGNDDAQKAAVEKHDRLHEAVNAVAQQGREVNTRKLGNFIRQHKDRFEGGLRFVRAGDSQGVARWKVEAAATKP